MFVSANPGHMCVRLHQLVVHIHSINQHKPAQSNVDNAQYCLELGTTETKSETSFLKKKNWIWILLSVKSRTDPFNQSAQAGTKQCWHCTLLHIITLLHNYVLNLYCLELGTCKNPLNQSAQSNVDNAQYCLELGTTETRSETSFRKKLNLNFAQQWKVVNKSCSVKSCKNPVNQSAWHCTNSNFDNTRYWLFIFWSFDQ